VALPAVEDHKITSTLAEKKLLLQLLTVLYTTFDKILKISSGKISFTEFKA
jgi:hypothetical protein